jgi:putative spermidine/putrescine transport system permease protein
MSKRTFVGACFVPLAVLVAAFFLLPMARLTLTGASGQDGLRAYAAILIDPRYRATLFNTVSLAAATTIATLVIATISGLFLQRHQFPGHALLVAMLTFPLAFPGVVVVASAYTLVFFVMIIPLLVAMQVFARRRGKPIILQ